MLVSGGFGVGKSVLLDGVVEGLRGRSVSVVCSQAREGDHDFDVFSRGLRERNMEDFIVERPMRINTVMLTCVDGRMVCSVQPEDQELDLDILGSMTTAVESFIMDSAQQATGKDFVAVDVERSLNVYQYKDFKLAMFRFRFGNITCLVEGEIADSLKADLNNLADMVENDFGDRLEHWDGISSGFEPIMDKMKKVLLERYTGEAPAIDPKFRQLRIMNRLLEKLEKQSERSKTAFIFDDMELADKASMETMAFLARNINKNVLVIAATEEDQELEGFTKISIGGMTTTDAQKLLAPHIPQDAPTWLADDIIQASNGNPLVMLENTQILQENGKSVYEDKAQMEKMLLRDSDHVITNRLRMLGDEAYSVLGWASIIGQEFNTDMLENIHGKNLPDLDNIEIIEKTSDGYKFKDARTRKAIVCCIPDAAEKHLKVAETLESLLESSNSSLTVGV